MSPSDVDLWSAHEVWRRVLVLVLVLVLVSRYGAGSITSSSWSWLVFICRR